MVYRYRHCSIKKQIITNCAKYGRLITIKSVFNLSAPQIFLKYKKMYTFAVARK